MRELEHHVMGFFTISFSPFALMPLTAVFGGLYKREVLEASTDG